MSLLDGMAEAGDRVVFQLQQMGGAGFVVATMGQPGAPADQGVAMIAVLEVPQLIAAPLAACRVLERGALTRAILTPIDARLAPSIARA